VLPFPPRLLIGTSTSGRGEDTVRREAAAQASLAALSGADAMNIRFIDESALPGPVESLSLLTLDAPRVTGRAGPRKPIVSELIDVLTAEAVRRGRSRVALVNGDICVRQVAVDTIAALRHPAVAVSRLETGRGIPETILLHGVDMIVVDVLFWQAHRARFRAYIMGEPAWDNVYASIAVCHGGVLLNREALITHERHETAAGSPFGSYGHLLATRDRAYFSRWCEYVAQVEQLRASGGSVQDEQALQDMVFKAPGRTAALADALRAAWWRTRVRYHGG
jgi:hypothetical protein